MNCGYLVLNITNKVMYCRYFCLYISRFESGSTTLVRSARKMLSIYRQFKRNNSDSLHNQRERTPRVTEPCLLCSACIGVHKPRHAVSLLSLGWSLCSKSLSRRNLAPSLSSKVTLARKANITAGQFSFHAPNDFSHDTDGIVSQTVHC